MALDHAVEHLGNALTTLASGDAGAQERLQRAWTDDVQMLWMKPCLPAALNARFRTLWKEYTGPGDDPHRTNLRALTPDELDTAVRAVVALALDAVAAHAAGEEPAPPG